MLIPTGVTFAEYWNAIKVGNPTHVRMTFEGQEFILDDRDIESGSGISITDILNGDIDLVFGRSVAKQIQIGIVNSSRVIGLNWESEFLLEMGVEINSVTQWVTIGYFSGEKPNNVTTANVIDYTAYDRMKLFDILADDFVAGMTYPATVRDIYDSLCEFVGLENDVGDELPNIMNRSYAQSPAEMSGYTCRDILSWIAEASGCYAKINADGHVQLVWFQSNTDYMITGDDEFHVESGDIGGGMTWDEADLLLWDEIDRFTWDEIGSDGATNAIRVDQLLIKQLGSDLDVDYPSATGGNVYMIVENPFLSVGSAQEITDYIAPLYDRLDSFGGYLPVNIDCVGNWCIEAGDIIMVEVFTKLVRMPIFVKNMKWNGTVHDTYESTGQKQRAIYANNNTKQKVLINNEIKLIADTIVTQAEEYTDGKLTAYSTTTQTATQISQYVANNAYEKKSGIDITADGVEIDGNKYIILQSGNTNLKLSPSQMYFTGGNAFLGTTTAGYTIWVNGFYFTHGTDYSGETYSFFVRTTNGTDWFYLSNNTLGTYIRTNGFYSFGARGQTNRELRMDLVNNRVLVYGSNGIQFGDTNSIYGRIDYIYVGTLNYNTITQNSSREIKHDIKPLESVGEKLDKLEPVTFVYDDDTEERTKMGLIYEDTMEVMPEICTQDESEKGISYVELIPAMLKEIQELRARVKALEERIGE